MKIFPRFSSFNISAFGMGIEKRKMDLIAENIANTGTTKTEEGTPYKKKFLSVTEKKSFELNLDYQGKTLDMKRSSNSHITGLNPVQTPEVEAVRKFKTVTGEDKAPGELVYMPDHPDANAEGYVELPNVNVINEMVDMIAASRSFEANLTAFNSAKQIAKDSLEI